MIALGRVTEFIDTTEQIKKIYAPYGIETFANFKKTDFVDGKGLYTDDTVMAKIVIEVMIEAKRNVWQVDKIIETLAEKFAALFGPDKYKIDPYFDYRAHGPTNRKAGENLFKLMQEKSKKQSWWITSKSENYDKIKDSEVASEGGCGSIMRVWPIGLIYHDQLDFALKLADEQSKLTHRHPMARAACAAMVAGVACAYKGLSVDEIVAQMVQAAEKFDQAELIYKPNAKKISDVKDLNSDLIKQDKLLTSDMIRYAYQMAKINKRPEEVLGTHNKKQANYRSTEGFLLGWAADESVAAAVYLIGRNHDNLINSIIEAVNTPGDSDSIATLSGALVGASSVDPSVLPAALFWPPDLSGCCCDFPFTSSKLENYDSLCCLFLEVDNLLNSKNN